MVEPAPLIASPPCPVAGENARSFRSPFTVAVGKKAELRGAQ